VRTSNTQLMLVPRCKAAREETSKALGEIRSTSQQRRELFPETSSCWTTRTSCDRASRTKPELLSSCSRARMFLPGEENSLRTYEPRISR